MYSQAETGESWCPDCALSDTKVIPLFASLPDKALLVVECPKEAYKSPDYVLRASTSVALSCVPTLMRMDDTRVCLRRNCCSFGSAMSLV